MTKKRIGRPPKNESDRSIQITLAIKDVIQLDKLIFAISGPLTGSMTRGSEQAQRRRDYLSGLIQDAVPMILKDVHRSFEDQVSRLTSRVEAVESPFLDFVGELLLLKDAVKNIEYQYDKRLDALEAKEK